MRISATEKGLAVGENSRLHLLRERSGVANGRSLLLIIAKF